MQHLFSGHPKVRARISTGFPSMSRPGKVLRVCRIKPHTPPLVRAPVNSLSFSLAAVVPRRNTNALESSLQGSIPTTTSVQRLRRGLPGYLILFAPHAFAPQCQYPSRWSPSPPVFLPISTNFTSTLGILPPSPGLEPASIDCTSLVEPGDFTVDLAGHLRALYAQSFRATFAPSVLPRLLAQS